MRKWSLLPVLLGIGVLVAAANGKWAFSEKPAGTGLTALSVVIGIALIVGPLALWRWLVLREAAIAVPGVKPQSGVGRTLGSARSGQGGQMDFENDAQRACYTAVRSWVAAIYGEQAMVDEELPRFLVPVMDILVGIGVRPLANNEAYVNIWVFPIDENPVPFNERALRYMLEGRVPSAGGID